MIHISVTVFVGEAAMRPDWCDPASKAIVLSDSVKLPPWPKLKEASMKALLVAFIYLAPFIIIGVIARMIMKQRMKGASLGDIQEMAGPNRRKRRLFLLGSWRDED